MTQRMKGSSDLGRCGHHNNSDLRGVDPGCPRQVAIHQEALTVEIAESVTIPSLESTNTGRPAQRE
jgi:hypothetical protein